MLNATSMEDLEMLLINAYQGEINGMNGIDKEIQCVTTTIDLVTLQDSIGTKTWIEEVYYIKEEIHRKMTKEKES